MGRDSSAVRARFTFVSRTSASRDRKGANNVARSLAVAARQTLYSWEAYDDYLFAALWCRSAKSRNAFQSAGTAVCPLLW